jgi:AraC family transcriptional regulator
MQPRFEILSEKKLVGLKIETSLADNKTGLLWQGFMPRRNEIGNMLHTNLFSLQVYPPNYFSQAFDPSKIYIKWALAEVLNFDAIPHGMESFVLEGGLYAVFDYKATISPPVFFQQLYMHWLPQSGYELDQRPHFELLGEKYIKDDPNSEEEVWIPVKLK